MQMINFHSMMVNMQLTCVPNHEVITDHRPKIRFTVRQNNQVFKYSLKI